MDGAEILLLLVLAVAMAVFLLDFLDVIPADLGETGDDLDAVDSDSEEEEILEERFGCNENTASSLSVS